MLELQQPEFKLWGVNFNEFLIKPEMKLVPSVELAGGEFELFEVRVKRVKNG